MEEQKQFTENQQGRIDSFAKEIEELSKKHGCKIVPSVTFSPLGAKYMIQLIPDEVLNPKILPAGGPTPEQQANARKLGGPKAIA